MSRSSAGAPASAGSAPSAGEHEWFRNWRAELTDVPYAEFEGELTWTVECEQGSLLTADCPKHLRERVAKFAAAAPKLYETLERAREWLSRWASAEPYISIIDGVLAKAGSAPPASENALRRVLLEIAGERLRQIHVEGWTPEHDDQHANGALAKAAAGYAAHAGHWARAVDLDTYPRQPAPDGWPWADKWWKPKDRRRDLVRAAALLVAEIERLDRAEARGEVA